MIAHEPLPGMLPPFNRIPALPAANPVLALLFTTPPQVLVIELLATVIEPPPLPAGNTSVKLAFVSVTALLLNSVTVSVATPPDPIVLGENDLVMLGLANTVIVAAAGNALLPEAVTNAPAGIEFV